VTWSAHAITGLLEVFFAVEMGGVGRGRGTGESKSSTSMLCSDDAKPEVVAGACGELVDGCDGELRSALSFSISYEVVELEVPELAVEAFEASRLRACAGDRERLRLPIVLIEKM
jgi:hypothetical protein